MRPIGPSLLLVLGHMFISKAHSDNQRIDYHLTYPSSPRVFSLAYGVAETNNSKIWSSRGGRQISALVFKERKNALDVAHSCRSSTSCPSNCKVLVMILPASCIYCFHMKKHLGNIIAQHNSFFFGQNNLRRESACLPIWTAKEEVNWGPVRIFHSEPEIRDDDDGEYNWL